MYGILDNKFNKINCPLKKVHVESQLDKENAFVNITQEYIYLGNASIEAIYKFPLIHNRQVTGFIIRIGEEQIKGELQERDKAYQLYENAIRKGDSSFLLEQKRSGSFQISLGNIAPKEKIHITITYIEDLDTKEEGFRWLLPTAIAPRYTPMDMTELEETKELMLEITARQTADGSFNNDEIKTAYYVLAMILYKEQSKPYINQIKKSIEYIINSNISLKSPILYISLKFAVDNNIMVKGLIEKVEQLEGMDLLKNLAYLYNSLNRDIKEFTSILFNLKMDRKGLIKFLLDQL